MPYSNLDSVDNILKAQEAGGVLMRMMHGYSAAITPATISSGYMTTRRFPINFTTPALTGYDGYFYDVRFVPALTVFGNISGIEYHLGSINLATGTYTADQPAPTKSIRVAGVTTSRQTAFPSGCVFAVITSAIGASATTLDLTYTDQDGNTGATTSGFIVPASAQTNSAYILTPDFMASGDSGIRAITACTKSGATTGTIDFYGILPVAWNLNQIGYNSPNFSNLNNATFPKYIAESGDKLGFYDFGSASSSNCDYIIIGRPI